MRVIKFTGFYFNVKLLFIIYDFDQLKYLKNVVFDGGLLYTPGG